MEETKIEREEGFYWVNTIWDETHQIGFWNQEDQRWYLIGLSGGHYEYNITQLSNKLNDN